MEAENKKISQLLDIFLDCVNAEEKSEAEREAAKSFNTLFDEYLEENQDVSVASFAHTIADNYDVDYEDAFKDLSYIRSLTD